MARRKVLIANRSGAGWLAEALGYWSLQSKGKILHEVPSPQIDFSAIEHRTGLPVEAEVSEEIQQAFSLYAEDVFVTSIEAGLKANGIDLGLEGDIIDQTKFNTLVEKIELKALELERLIDSLADFSSGLLVRPKDNRDRSSRSYVLGSFIEKHHRCDFPSYELDMEAFSDYYTFRKLLDYFGRFQAVNQRFNNRYSLRWSLETGHTNYERFVRRVVVALMRSGYPATITIPTDTNPDYESPLIAALLEVQDQHNLAFKVDENNSLDFTQTLGYRQFAHLVSLIIDDVRKWEEVFSSLSLTHR